MHIYKFIITHKEILCVALLCCLAFFIHSYALPRDLIFAYDQGRDAFVVKKILSGDLVLLGAVTGLNGIFLGPFFMYLIAPFYFLGRGDPLYPAYFLIGLRSLTVLLMYYLGKRAGGWKMGLIAGVLFTFSFKNILFSRWLSNPTPLTFFSLLLMFTVLHAVRYPKLRWFVLIGVLLGLCMQMESSNAITYFLVIPAFILSVWLQEQNITESLSKYKKYIICALFGLATTLVPQVLFEFRHGFLMTHALIRSFSTPEHVSLIYSLPIRLKLLVLSFSDAVFYRMPIYFVPFFIGLLLLLWAKRNTWWKNVTLRLVVFWFVIPFLFHLFYTGNKGNFWDYYMIAQFVPFYLLLGWAATKVRTVFVVIIISIAVISNMRIWTDWLHPYNDRYAWSMQVAAARFMTTDSAHKSYGVWVYTPSYQDEADRYAIDYVGRLTGIYPKKHVEQQRIIYLLIEDDPVYWKRRDEWIRTNESFGIVASTHKYGALTLIRMNR